LTKSCTVNGAAFPGTNMNGGASMATQFTDIGSGLLISTTTLSDGTYTYTFAYKVTFNDASSTSVTTTFTV